MINRSSFLFLFLLTMAATGLGQAKQRFDQLSAIKQDSIKTIAAKYSNGAVKYEDVRKSVLAAALDNPNLSIEDLIELVFMIADEDAQKEMKALLDEMNAEIKEKEALRQLVESTKKKMDSLNNRFGIRVEGDSLYQKDELAKKEKELDQYNSREKQLTAAENKNAADRMAAGKHLQSIRDAIRNLHSRH